MEEKKYMISDAAKQVEVESHVLRYWEEELELPIKRNKMGHRYYTSDDVNRLKRVKAMKEQGFQLKAIKNTLKGELLSMEESSTVTVTALSAAETMSPRDASVSAVDLPPSDGDKVLRLQILLKNMMLEAVKEGNELLGEQIKESILKELDYQFRMQEEREEVRENERVQREEEHFKKVDELLREKIGRRGERKADKAEKKEKRKKHPFF